MPAKSRSIPDSSGTTLAFRALFFRLLHMMAAVCMITRKQSPYIMLARQSI